MARFEILSIVIFAIVLAILSQQATALKCWDCNSVEQQFCGTSWDKSKLSSKDKDIFNKVCPGNCYKIVAKVKGDVNKVKRGCALNDQAVQNECTAAKPPNVDIKDYQCTSSTCNKDGCNGAAQYGPIALFTILPVAIAKLFLF